MFLSLSNFAVLGSVKKSKSICLHSAPKLGWSKHTCFISILLKAGWISNMCSPGTRSCIISLYFALRPSFFMALKFPICTWCTIVPNWGIGVKFPTLCNNSLFKKIGSLYSSPNSLYTFNSSLVKPRVYICESKCVGCIPAFRASSICAFSSFFYL